MAIFLKVTSEALIAEAGDIEAQIKNIEQQFETIGEEINRTRSYWEGEASEAHMSQFDAIKDEIQEVVKRLKGQPKKLLVMADLYNETVDDNTEIIQSLLDDVII